MSRYLFLVALLLLAGCGSIPSFGQSSPTVVTSPTPTAMPTAIPSGWRLHRTSSFQIALPDTWDEMPLTERELRAYADELKAGNPQVAAMVEQLLQSGSFKRVSFFAIDMRGTPEFGENISAQHVAVGREVTSQQVLDQTIPAMRSNMPSFKVLAGKAGLAINQMDVAELQYEFALVQPDGKPLVMRGVQFSFIKGGEVDVVTMTGLPNGDFIARAERIGYSFTHDLTPAPAEQPTSVVAQATPSPSAADVTGTVIHGGNLRSAPKVDPQNVIGQVCPADRVVFLGGRQVGAALWYQVRIEGLAKDCDPKRAPAGSSGWVHSTLLSEPSTPVKVLGQ